MSRVVIALSPGPPVEGDAPDAALRRLRNLAEDPPPRVTCASQPIPRGSWSTRGPPRNGGVSPPAPARLRTESCLPPGSVARHPEEAPPVHPEGVYAAGRRCANLSKAE